MACVADAVQDERSLLEPVCGFQTTAFAHAKRHLRAGEALDRIGGYACYGLIDNCDAGGHAGLPICLGEDLALRRDVPQDAAILMTDVEVPEGRANFETYARALAAPV
jgi:predicted homoserine dehydrogenase-like protein